MRVVRAAILVVMTIGATSGTAYAQLTGTLGAELDLTTACTLSGESETTGVDFGLLDFGTQPATFVGLLQAQAAGTGGNTEILCSADVTGVTITVDGGGNGGQGTAIGDGSRALTDGEGNFVPYEVYSTSGTTSPYPSNGSGVSVTIATPGEPFVLPIFGRVNKTSPNALAAGNYTDTLQVTIEF
ncbi:MAG: spore coat protein U domain-containing protein [Vicinamibacterales bacterium]